MEIDQAHFRPQLLSILQHIANASFVTFDLEMSGISTRPKHSTGNRTHDVGKPSLQAQYDEMRSAAETFQVLQVGITCVEEDRDKEFYLARPFNFNLTPLSADGVDLRLDRQFTFSASACDFLNRNRFDFGKIFSEGVPYLSRDEEEERREEYAQRASKNAAIPDIVIGLEDVATLEFSRTTRKAIAAWAKDEKAEYAFCNIGNDAGPMNAFQRRIVHQIVRNEFPALRVFARNDGHFMQVEKLDVEREESFQRRQATRFNASIGKQKGLRWIFEALAGGDLSGIDPEWFRDKSSPNSESDWKRVQSELATVTTTLRTHRPLIVGHNLFADLAFLFRTFVGHLPVNVKHFQEDIHALFPRVIDTKYVATYNTDAMNPRVGLKDLLAPFRKTHTPLIVLHENHTAYGAGFGKEHEAGFDSWMTAELFVKLAASKVPVQATTPSAATCPPPHPSSSSSSDNDSDCHGGGAMLGGHQPPAWHAAKLNGGKKKSKSKSKINSNSSNISTSNPFSVLLNSKDDDDTDESNPKQWLPSFEDKFWHIYMNKLRVNASEGGVCDLEERENDERLDGLRRKFKKASKA
ncbi:uncharacterized protein L3040_006764 [Drepanopeziza brunnea f. sp. 'multigermtubi']|uniref:CAF1 family ribonuclease n=1 Tax=Marssonina brunnea f. sp. multigermtubi (strain MB_m1) TaxID=1072389 RepID=K1WZD8_MARBU|nr:CAF1 family ribonuclease [Drepanopeziza brunnea f. sp. 'multigermtubi' MB_m1]EKD18361.1 CAF1 family ribonuclease [Drepanopeziza brunnea f. sp. 'multigermtubi' MB_m1]KAJ5039094.1 hypothetical protein L3040_006764 [Drepanopeziza brunnea f. sp. 'multigermtubi']